MRSTLLIFLAIVASSPLGAQPVTTHALGEWPLVVPAGGETRVGIPFEATAVWRGLLGAGASDSLAFAAVSGEDPLTPAAYAPQGGVTWFACLGRGASDHPLAGKAYAITANSGRRLYVDPAGDDLTALPNKTPVRIVAGWTLEALLSAVQIPASDDPFQRAFEVQLLNPQPQSTDPGAVATWYREGVQWREVGSADPAGATPVAFHAVLLLRNYTANAVTVRFQGRVVNEPSWRAAHRDATTAIDTPLALPSLEPVPLAQLGLITQGLIEPSPAIDTPGDELHVYPAGAIPMHALPTARYYYAVGQWRPVGQPDVDVGEVPLVPAQSFVVRLAPTATATPAWTWPAP